MSIFFWTARAKLAIKNILNIWNFLLAQKKAGDYMVSTNPTKYYYKEGESTKEELMLPPKNMLEIMLPLIGKLNGDNDC